MFSTLTSIHLFYFYLGSFILDGQAKDPITIDKHPWILLFIVIPPVQFNPSQVWYLKAAWNIINFSLKSDRSPLKVHRRFSHRSKVGFRAKKANSQIPFSALLRLLEHSLELYPLLLDVKFRAILNS